METLRRILSQAVSGLKIVVTKLVNFGSAMPNCGEDGTPKSAIVGTVERAAYSGQSIRFVMRASDFIRKYGRSYRTANMPEVVVEEAIQKCQKDGLAIDPKCKNALKEALAKIGTSLKAEKENVQEDQPIEDQDDDTIEEVANDKKMKTQPIVWTEEQLINITKVVVDTLKKANGKNKELTALLKGPKKTKKGEKKVKSPLEKFLDDVRDAISKADSLTVDIALFGRMVTDKAIKNVQSAVSNSRAIGTHALVREDDFFSSIDELAEQRTANMLGNTCFNSACYFSQCEIDLGILAANLADTQYKDKIIEIVLDAIRAFVYCNPLTHKTVFNANPSPDLIMIDIIMPNEAASDYTNAFVVPVKTDDWTEDIVYKSVEQLNRYVDKYDKGYGGVAKRAYFTLDSGKATPPAHCVSFENIEEMLSTCATWLKESEG